MFITDSWFAPREADVKHGAVEQMRIVAWNANHNNQRRSWAENVELLRPLHADILVISETARPTGAPDERVHCIGDCSPTLAVAAKSNLLLEAHPENANAPDLMGAWQVSGSLSVKLLAAWPVQRSSSFTYHQLLMRGLDIYGPFLADGPAIFAGDLNTSARVRSQERTHHEFVEKTERLGLRSVYHKHSGEAHGHETLSTFRMGGRTPKSFHIDYCFVSESLADAAFVNIPRSRVWLDRSDHCPLVLDIPDSAFDGASHG